MRSLFIKYSIILIPCFLFLLCGEKKDKIELNFSPGSSSPPARASDSESSIYTTLNISRKGKLVIGVLGFQNETNDESLNFVKTGQMGNYE